MPRADFIKQGSIGESIDFFEWETLKVAYLAIIPLWLVCGL